MKKIILILNILLLAFRIHAQTPPNFNKIDKYALQAPKKITTSIDQLSNYLTQPYKSDIEKVRSIFAWVIHYIQYDKAAYNNGNKRINKSNEDVLERRKAVCFGYSTLFKALCNQAGVEAEVVVGFSKGTLTAQSKIGKPDHAWNAVKIDSTWHLLDATWASSLKARSDDFMATLNTNYFLTAPKKLILNHLPSDPMWQLLDCQITPDVFIKSSSVINKYIQTNENCIDYTDTLQAFERLNHIQKRVTSEERAYHFHPTIEMASEYGHTLLDYRAELADIAETLENTPHLDSLISIYQTMIELCEKAIKLTKLYDNQIENCAYTRINYAVALSQKVNDVTFKEQQAIFKTMKIQTLQAKKELESLPSSFLIMNGLQRCEQILEYLE